MDITFATSSLSNVKRSALRDALARTLESEIAWPRDLNAALEQGVLDAPPYNKAFGPTRPRGGVNGVILQAGEELVRWGETERADYTFSVAKSYLALLAGVAWRDGLLPDVDAPVIDAGMQDLFDTPQNRSITWRHLLQQTSEWEGTLFGLPDLVDRHRVLARDGDNALKGTHRDLHTPGQFWEYNDVRVNLLSLCLMRLFQRELPEVLREEIMQPLGATGSWQWHGYDNSTVVVDGKPLVSVPGGTHWGGGLCISASDQALAGQLVLQRGVWNGSTILPSDWIDAMLTPCAIRPDYGYLWWLNTGYAFSSCVSEQSVFAMGAGGNVIWIDPTNDLVAVVRWLDPAAFDPFARAVLNAVT